jgi:predicted XRE-type DNA-binding protein
MSEKLKPGLYRATVRGVDKIVMVGRLGDYATTIKDNVLMATWGSADQDIADARPLIVLDTNALSARIIADILRDSGYAGVARQIEAQTKPARIPEPDDIGARVTAGDGGMAHSCSTGPWIDHERRLQAEPHLMKASVCTSGYPAFTIRLTATAKETQKTVHSAVAEAFLGAKPEGPGRIEVRHLDNNKQNNRAENLEWGTAKQNAEDRVRAGATAAGERNNHAKLTRTDVEYIRAMVAGKVMTGVEAAKCFGVTKSAISSVVNRKTWKATL